MFRGGQSAQELLRRYRVDYVLVGPYEKDEFPNLDEAFLRRIAKEQVRIGDCTLYRVD